jgi:MoaA/NifB/PqqE/SkfB family radical SAM enzyme
MARDRKQEAPFSIILSLTEGCNLYCSFCGLRSIREENKPVYKLMTPENLDIIFAKVAAAGWKSRIHLAGMGEPTMNPRFVECIAIIRKHLPRNQILLISNGGGLLRKPGPVENIRALFAAGVNILTLDDYKDANIVPKIRRALDHPDDQLVDIPVYEFDGAYGSDGNPFRRYPVGTQFLTYMKDLKITEEETTGIRSRMHNSGGASAPPNAEKAGKRCHRPFRELTIRYDGKVPLCCQDWRGAYKVGDLLTDPLDAVWQGSALNAARRKLYAGQRDFGPCDGCDSHSYRAGLLPDPAGKATLPRPTAETAATIAATLAGPSWTAPVLRPWEKV